MWLKAEPASDEMLRYLRNDCIVIVLERKPNKGAKFSRFNLFVFARYLFFLDLFAFEVSFSVSLKQTTFNAFFVAVIYIPKYSMSKRLLLALTLLLTCPALSGHRQDMHGISFSCGRPGRRRTLEARFIMTSPFGSDSLLSTLRANAVFSNPARYIKKSI